MRLKPLLRNSSVENPAWVFKPSNRENLSYLLNHRVLSATLAYLAIFSVVGTATAGVLSDKSEVSPSANTNDQTREFLERILYTPEYVEKWLNGGIAKDIYDATLGWRHHPGIHPDGVDGARCEYSYDSSGARRMIQYKDRECRINTYGNSFTHCDQVSDGETWQEVLAAHLGEPIRNYGLSGHSVYQMYLRMLQEEKRTPCKYILMNIYSDDHYRSLSGWDAIISGIFDREVIQNSHRRPTKPHVLANPQTGEFIERPNPCPNPDSLYELCDPDWVADRFADDFGTKLNLARRHLRYQTAELSYRDIEDLGKENGIELAIDSPEALEEAIATIFDRVAFFASNKIVDKMEAFARENEKKILYILSYTQDHLAEYLKTGHRVDRDFVDFLDEKQLDYVDLLKTHEADFKRTNLSVEEYIARYYIGHYNPQGNFFTAFAIRPRLVDRLDPKPVAYRFE